MFLVQHLEWWLAIAGVVWLVCRKNWQGAGMAALLLGTYFLIRPENTGFVETYGEHPLARYHIWVSWGTRIALICAAIHAITRHCDSSECGNFVGGGQAPYGAICGRDVQAARLCHKYAPTPDAGLRPATPRLHTILRALIILQSLSILTGMIWAFDNAAWGSLWQWDSIELMSLVVWFALVYAYCAAPGQRYWAWISLFTILMQIELLLAPGGVVSRHDFFAEKISLIWPIFLAIWLTVLAGIAFWRLKTQPAAPLALRDIFSGMVLVFLGLLPMTPLFPNMPHAVFWMVSFILWAVLWVKPLRKLPLMVGTLTLAYAMMLPSGADRPLQEIVWANVGSDNYQLVGVHSLQENGCTRYHFDIAHGTETWNLPYLACDTALPPQAVDVWDGLVPRRLWALQYYAPQGVQLLARNIAPERLFELWLILLCLWFAIRNAHCKRFQKRAPASTV